ncbi:DUF4166 domain-containing protein, partial [Phenylobacterium sp.]|uniref:DUF4166 domain-containing protein n=1 Tax=Phenylobacterium sp. TaxID=1871053 RepID=UPI002E34E74F
IPSMAAEAIVRCMLAGRAPAPGARAAVAELELADYDQLFAGRTIVTGRRTEGSEAEAPPLYRRVLREAYGRLPAEIRDLHDRPTAMAGVAMVERGGHPLARLLANLFGFPTPGRTPVRVEFERTLQGGEVWRRNFGGRSFSSRQWEGRGRWAGLILESFGPVTVGLAPVVAEGRLELIVRRWSLFGVVLPRAWSPTGPAYEHVEEGRFAFAVTISHPWLGKLVSYEGQLSPATDA